MQHEMQANFGVSLSTRAVLFDWGTMDDVVEAAVIAEDSGYFSGVWVGDNLLSKPRVEAIVTLSAIAARTKRVSLGTICFASFPLRDPILLAIQWASLDVLSRGRTILAVCNGGSASNGPIFAQELNNMAISLAASLGNKGQSFTISTREPSSASVLMSNRHCRAPARLGRPLLQWLHRGQRPLGVVRAA